MDPEAVLHRLWLLGARLAMTDSGPVVRLRDPISAELQAELEQHRKELTVPLALGMTADDAVRLWQAIGSPRITLKQGVSTTDLAKVLAANCPVADLIAIREWFDGFF